PVADAARKRKRPLVAGSSALVVAGLLVRDAELGERVGLARHITDVLVQRHGFGRGGGRGRMVSSLPGQQAQFVERDRLTEPVPCLACRRQGRALQGFGLIPVTAGNQEAADRRGNLGGMPGASGLGGVAGGGIQVGSLSLQPSGRLLPGGQVGGTGRRGASRGAGGASPGGAGPASYRGSVQVVIEQPTRGGVTVGGVVRGGEGAGVLAEQVVQLVAAGHGLGEQVLVIQPIKAAAGHVEAGVVEGGSGVGV